MSITLISKSITLTLGAQLINPYQKAVRHAQECARRGQGVESCGYKTERWRSVWLKAFEEAKQIKLNFDKGKNDEL